MNHSTNTFLYILQNISGLNKIIHIQPELIKTTNKNTSERITYKYPNIWRHYYAHESNSDKDYTVYWVYHYINSLFYDIDQQGKIGYIIKDNHPFIYSIKNKYDKIKRILDNIFIDNKTKNEFMKNISKTQSAYRGFSKLAHIYKYKTAPIQITTNMMYDEIKPGHRDTIEIYHEGSRYLFTKHDLSRIINTSLINSPYYFAEPLVIRNPYNNVAFSKSILYTIYFRLVDNPLKFPILFHNFVWLDFDLHLFRAENECLIREQYFRDYIYNTPHEMMNIEIRNMLNVYYPTHIRITFDFPSVDLIRIFRPYYYLYMVSQYHIGGLEKIKLSSDYLIDKLYDFYMYNPYFGRVNYIMNNNGVGHSKIFNMDAPIFTMNQAYNYHLHKKKCTVCESESESESESIDSFS